MTPSPDQVFYIMNRGTGTGQPLVLGVQGDGMQPGTSVVLWPLETTDAQSQLWTMTEDGHILSQLNGLALTSSPQGAVVMQASAVPEQQWTVPGDGCIHQDVRVLTAGLDPPVSPGTGLYLLGEFAQDPYGQQQWAFLAPPFSGSPITPPWAYFQNGLRDAGGSACVLSVPGGSTTAGAGATVGAVQCQVGPDGLWQVMADGRIVSALDSNLVLTLGQANDGDGGGNFVTVDTVQDPLPLTQVWDLSTPNQIRSACSGDYVVPQGATDGPVTLDGNSILAAAGTPNPGYTWTVVPITRPKWVYFQSALTQADGSACVLNVEGGSTSPGADVILWPLGVEAARNELWISTSDGRILSAQGNSLVLTVGPASGDGNQVTVNSQQDPLPKTQVWDLIATPNQIRTMATGEYLVPQGGTTGPIVLDGNNVLTAPGTPNLSYVWHSVSCSSLAAVMAGGGTPFPPFAGGQALAYADINRRLMVTSLRAEYYNLTVTLADSAARIALWQPPDGVSQEDWDAVRDQLLLEITYADATRNLFANYGVFHLDLFEDEGFLLDKLISDAGMIVGEDDPNVQGIVLAVTSGLLYAGLSAMPGPFPVVANLMEMGINVAEAATSGGAMSPDPFQVAVSELWNQLSTNFEALLDAMGTLETAILQDWGKLQGVYALTQQPGGIGTLYWDPNTTGRLVHAARPGYIQSVMQMLLPAKYQIYWAPGQARPSGVPAYAAWQTDGGTYFIAEIGDYTKFPTQQVLQQDIWGTGVRQSDFFRDSADWGFPTSVYSHNEQARLVLCNKTPNLLLVSAEGATQRGGSWYVGPFQRTNLDRDTDDWMITVTDQNNAGTAVASFLWVESASVSRISQQQTVPGYQLSPPISCSYAGGDYNASSQISLSLG